MTSRRRPAAELFVALIRAHGSISAPELVTLTGIKSGNIGTALLPDIAAGTVRASKRLEQRGTRNSWVRVYEYAAGQPAAPRPAKADAPPLPRRQRGTTVRKCLCCQQPFNSEGPMNRLCGTCRTRSVGPYDAPAVVRYR